MAQDQAEADMECIVVDDCGTDRSMDVVRQTIAAYHGPIRFVIARHQQNRGLSAARNTGLEKTSGDYVCSSTLTIISFLTVLPIFLII